MQRVVLADDSVLLREGLVRLLTDTGFDVVAAVGDGDAAVAAACEHVPDLVVMDVRMPPGFSDEGIRAALTIREQNPDMAVVVLSQYVEHGYASKLLSATGSKVGYLLKDRVADVTEFVDTLERVVAGGTALDPDVVAQLFAQTRPDDPIDQLTPRETETLQLMAEGLTNAGIADRMVISGGAVEKHVSSIFAKLELHTSSHDHRRVLAVLKYVESQA